ncbi:hypothetical protein SESBI_46391 [Sesbania bispinosa]|nr:hypothetical protein SESBI_46391 [Sesbania bispinosa]
MLQGYSFHTCIPSYGEVFKETDCALLGGEVHAFHNLDVDTWSYFEAIGLLKDIGYNSPMKLWWKFKGGKVQNKWKEMKVDDDANEVSSYAELKKCEVHFYVENSVNQAIVTEVPKQLPYHRDDGGVTGGAGENVAGVAGVAENEGVAEQVDTPGKGVARNEGVAETERVAEYVDTRGKTAC